MTFHHINVHSTTHIDAIRVIVVRCKSRDLVSGFNLDMRWFIANLLLLNIDYPISQLLVNQILPTIHD